MTESMNPEEKARCLLLSHLTLQQLEDESQYGWFYVVGSLSGTRYRIRKYASFNIDRFTLDGQLSEALCFFVSGAPYSDQRLGQKILLENDEARVFTIDMLGRERLAGRWTDENWLKNRGY